MKRGLFRFVVALALVAFGLAAQADLISLKQRDYTDNITATNKFWFYESGHVYPSVEWIRGRTENFPVVYIKHTTATVVLTFENPQPFSDVDATFTVTSARLHIPASVAGTDTNVTLSTSVTDGTMHIEAEHGTDTCTVAFSGFPDYVTCGYIQITATVVGGSTTYWNSGSNAQWEHIYLTDGQPSGLQTHPWTDLLEYVCTWAHGQSGVTSVAAHFTKGLYHSGIWAYDQNHNSYWQEGTHVNYALALALTPPSSATMDCRDVSGFLALCALSMGESVQVRRSWRDETFNLTFKTNSLCPMGADSTNNANYGSFDFAFHQYAVIGDGVCDGALAQFVDYEGNSYKDVPTGWDRYSYWQSAEEEFVFYGLVWGLTGDSEPSAVTEDGDYRTIASIG